LFDGGADTGVGGAECDGLCDWPTGVGGLISAFELGALWKRKIIELKKFECTFIH